MGIETAVVRQNVTVKRFKANAIPVFTCSRGYNHPEGCDFNFDHLELEYMEQKIKETCDTNVATNSPPAAAETPSSSSPSASSSRSSPAHAESTAGSSSSVAVSPTATDTDKALEELHARIAQLQAIKSGEVKPKTYTVVDVIANDGQSSPSDRAQGKKRSREPSEPSEVIVITDDQEDEEDGSDSDGIDTDGSDSDGSAGAGPSSWQKSRKTQSKSSPQSGEKGGSSSRPEKKGKKCKLYAITRGKETGIFKGPWNDCSYLVDGYRDGKFKGEFNKTKIVAFWKKWSDDPVPEVKDYPIMTKEESLNWEDPRQECSSRRTTAVQQLVDIMLRKTCLEKDVVVRKNLKKDIEDLVKACGGKISNKNDVKLDELVDDQVHKIGNMRNVFQVKLKKAEDELDLLKVIIHDQLNLHDQP